MSEHQRTTNCVGEVFQWVDSTHAMVLDVITGEHRRFGKNYRSIGTLQEALEYVSGGGWEDRTVIVKLETIRGFRTNAPV